MNKAFCAEILGISEDKLTLVGQGANGVIFTDGELAFKFPKNQPALQKLKQEIKAAEQVKKHLSVNLPEYVAEHLDKPLGQAYCAYRLLAGEPLTPEIYLLHREKMSAQLLGLLDEIHGMDFVTNVGEPTDFAEMYREIRSYLFPKMTDIEKSEVESRFESYLAGQNKGVKELCAVHGDFGGSNILCDRQTGLITAVIDWSELSLDDPVFDYSSLTCQRSIPQCRQDLLKLRPSLAKTFDRMDFIQYTFPLQDMLWEAKITVNDKK